MSKELLTKMLLALDRTQNEVSNIKTSIYQEYKDITYVYISDFRVEIETEYNNMTIKENSIHINKKCRTDVNLDTTENIIDYLAQVKADKSKLKIIGEHIQKIIFPIEEQKED